MQWATCLSQTSSIPAVQRTRLRAKMAKAGGLRERRSSNKKDLAEKPEKPRKKTEDELDDEGGVG